MQGEQPIERQFGDLSVTQLIVMAGLPGAGKSTIGEIVGQRDRRRHQSRPHRGELRERQRIEIEREAGTTLALRLRRREEDEHYEPMKASAASTFEPSDSTLSIVTRGSADEGPVHAA